MPKVSGLIVPNLYANQWLHVDGCVSVVLFYKCKKAGEFRQPFVLPEILVGRLRIIIKNLVFFLPLPLLNCIFGPWQGESAVSMGCARLTDSLLTDYLSKEQRGLAQ